MEQLRIKPSHGSFATQHASTYGRAERRMHINTSKQHGDWSIARTTQVGCSTLVTSIASAAWLVRLASTSPALKWRWRGRPHVACDSRESKEDLAEPLLSKGGGGKVASGHGTVLSSILNLTATAMGSGLLTLPYAYAVCGPGSCTLLLFLLAVTSDVTLANLVHAGRQVKASTFGNTLQKVLGGKSRRAFQLVTACVLFLAMASMERIVADLLPIFIERMLGLPAGQLSVGWLCCAVNAVVMVACLSSTIHALRFTSSGALLCLAPFIISIVSKALFGAPPNSSSASQLHSAATSAAMPWHEGLLVASPLLASSLMCHFSILEIDAELRPSSKRYIYFIIHVVALVILPGVYAAVGLAGYRLFGTNAAENILVEFQSDRVMQFARGVMSITSALRIPLMVFPLRAMVQDSMKSDGAGSAAGKESKMQSKAVLAGQVIIMLAGATLAAFKLERLTNVMGLLGGTCGVLGCFIVPSILALALPKGLEFSKEDGRKAPWPRAVVNTTSAAGLVVGVLVSLATYLAWRGR